MKYPTLRKVMLASMALVASLALSAQAGRPTLSSAKQTNGPNNGQPSASARQAGNSSWHHVLFPASTYMVDDGTAEDAIGLTVGGDIIALNKFAVLPGAETIATVSIAWGTPAFPDPSLNGLPYTVAIWSDPNGDGSPTDAVLLNTAGGVVASQGTDTFILTDIPDTTITTTNFFVGFLITHSGGQFPAAFDQTAPTFSNVSYAAGGASGDINNLNNNEIPVASIESLGLVGNWLIRADATGEPSPTPTPTPTIPPAGALWYNGDFDDIDGLTNEQDTFATGFSHIYDDFNVNDSAGWDVDSVFSDDLISTTVTGATWEIRQGITSGNGGTLIASGTTMTPVVTATGRSGFGFTEFMVEVTGLSVHLDPGTYHLNVTPIGNLDGNRSFNSTTSGANCIGTPCGDNDNAFLDSTLFGAIFEPVADFGSQFHDFSMGVNGVVSGGGGCDITLSATFRHKHDNRLVALSWTPADGGTIDILRDGVVIRTVEDDGRAQDHLGTGGREVHVYQVCETDTGCCSNELKLKVPGSGGQ
ncbi:MAG: hypothetical protein ABIU29_01805 [Chthoniobacterales bacterium]